MKVVAIDRPLAERLKEQNISYYFKENSASGNHKAPSSHTTFPHAA